MLTRNYTYEDHNDSKYNPIPDINIIKMHVLEAGLMGLLLQADHCHSIGEGVGTNKKTSLRSFSVTR